MRLNYIISGMLIFLWVQICVAAPSVEIIQSCKTGLPVNLNIKMTNIRVKSGFAQNPEEGCEYQYEMHFQDKIYGSVICEDTFYFVVAGRKIPVNSAENVLHQQQVKPGYLVPNVSKWWKIDKDQSSYLCISGPLSQSGEAAAYKHYYLIEGAFDLNATPKSYYYFYGFKEKKENENK